MVTDAYRISESVQTRFARLTDIFNQHARAHLTITHATISQPRRMPSKDWRELIKKVWEADAQRCSKGPREKCTSLRSSTASLLHLLTQSRDTNEYG